MQQPTCRSRTLLFLSYRDSRARTSRFSKKARYAYEDDNDDGDGFSNVDGDDENQRLISNASSSAHSSSQLDLPPAWVDFSEQVEQILADTQSKIQLLEKLHAKHVLPGFTDRTQEEREIESATTDITKDFRRCQTLIQRVGTTSTSSAHTFPPGSSNNRNHHEDLAAKNVQRALAAKVQDLSAAFRKKQRVYMEKLQGHAIKNQDLLIASGTISLKGSEGLSAVDDDIAAASHTRHQHGSGGQQQSQAQTTLDPGSVDIQSRDRELTEIARSIASLAELFKDLSALVIDQGTLLDSVEYNIEQTAVEMKESVRELDVATRYQKNTGRRKCIFLLLLIIFGLILVLIFKPRRHSSNTPSIPSPNREQEATPSGTSTRRVKKRSGPGSGFRLASWGSRREPGSGAVLASSTRRSGGGVGYDPSMGGIADDDDGYDASGAGQTFWREDEIRIADRVHGRLSSLNDAALYDLVESPMSSFGLEGDPGRDVSDEPDGGRIIEADEEDFDRPLSGASSSSSRWWTSRRVGQREIPTRYNYAYGVP